MGTLKGYISIPRCIYSLYCTSNCQSHEINDGQVIPVCTWLAECYVVVEQICSNGYFIDMKFEVALRLKKKPNVIQ